MHADWRLTVLGVAGGTALIWLLLVAALWCSRPDDTGVRDAIRLLPDLIRLLKRLAADPAVDRGVRIRVALLMVYLAAPIDLIPDFVPVLGYADDAVIVALVLRSAVRRAGPHALSEHWPGTPEGLAALRGLCRLPDQ